MSWFSRMYNSVRWWLLQGKTTIGSWERLGLPSLMPIVSSISIATIHWPWYFILDSQRPWSAVSGADECSVSFCLILWVIASNLRLILFSIPAFPLCDLFVELIQLYHARNHPHRCMRSSCCLVEEGWSPSLHCLITSRKLRVAKDSAQLKCASLQGPSASTRHLMI